MNAREWAGKNYLIWGGYLRGLFSGLGYAVSLTLTLTISWGIEDHNFEYPGMSFAEALRATGESTLGYTLATFPPLPLLVLILNIAPRAAIKRAIWLALPVVVMTLWGYLFAPGESRDSAIGVFGERLMSALLIVAVCQYHNSARGAAGALLRTRIQTATLGVELDRARLQMLRSQIEPHFLFNTLANVRRLAHVDRSAAVELIDNLMRYLDAALPKLRQDDSPLSDEMQLVDAYLSIFRVRMGSRLTYALVLPPDLAPFRVPTMMLLTLVENALKHGINPMVEGGYIRVSAARLDSAVVLKVADSGHGIPDQQSYGTGAGLANVRMRLKMQYGEAAVLTLAQAEPRGVVAAISLPDGAGA